MEDSLENPHHSDENRIYINISPKKYYPEKSGAHTVTLPDGTIINVIYDGILPYIPVWDPTLA